MCTNPAAVRVFRNCGQKIVFYGFQKSREALFRRAYPAAVRAKDCFLWIPKVTWGTFSACVLLTMCSNPAAVRVFRNCGQKIIFYGFQRSREALFRRAFCLPCARILLLFECFGTADKRLFFMDSKGRVRHFFGVRFASHVHDSCCCSSVSELRTKDCFLWIPKVTWGTFSACVLLSMCSNPAAVRVFRNCGQKIVFYGFQRSREAPFRRAFCLACARILLLFECFGTAGKRLFFMDSKGHVRHFFGVRFAYHVLESCCCSSVSELRTKDCFLWIPKVTWSTFSACVLLSMNPVAVRLFRNCGQKILLLFECFGTADKRLFFMDSKGHVKHFFGVRFA